MAAAQTEGQKKNIQDHYASQQRRNYTAFVETFTRTYQAEAISLRDQMLRRLPVGSRSADVTAGKAYESPTNSLSVEEAARDLERLARLL